MYKKLKQLLEELKDINPSPFIGYGNPDADILIIGKECAEPEFLDEKKQIRNPNNEKFIKPNYEHWMKSFEGHGFSYGQGEPYDFEHGNFHPINPFYKLENKKQTKAIKIGRPSSTWYWYQCLIDKIKAGSSTQYEKSPYINFFDYCFITELNDICRTNNNRINKKEREETESHIRKRFNWMRQTNFFNQFKVVILACGPSYRKAIDEDSKLEKDLFGNAKIFRTSHQLSYWDKDLDKIISEINKSL